MGFGKRSHDKKRRRGACLTAGLVVVLAVVSTAAATPEWRLPDLQGRAIGPADYPGQWVVVNFWATWCKPCREEMPALDRIASGNDDVAVLGVAWEDADRAELERFLERVPVGYPVLRVDPFDPPPDVEPPRVLPTTLIFAPDGTLAERFHGPVSRADIQGVVDRGNEGPGGEP